MQEGMRALLATAVNAAAVALALAAAHAAAAEPLMLFGLQVGAPVTVPMCASTIPGLRPTPKSGICWIPPKAAPATTKAPGDAEGELIFSVQESPAYVSGMSAKLQIVDGSLEGVTFFTGGLAADILVMPALVAKFGEPSKVLPQVFRNRFGAAVDAPIRMWERDDGFSVVYSMTIGAATTGVVIMSTRKGTQAADARRQSRESTSTMRPL